MPTYYEVLKLESNASIEIIEVAIDDNYKQYRHLVNHHDPNVVEQANRALRQLEEIRSTLTNAEKRAIYDQSLNFGGLADPTAILQGSSSGTVIATPPPPKPASQDDAGLTAWKCGQCGKASRVGSKTCSNCGKILARDCPHLCGNVVLLNDIYCSSCGRSIQEGLSKLQIEFERAQKAFVDDLRSRIQSKRNDLNRLSEFSAHLPWNANSAVKKLKELTGETVNVNLGISGYILVFLPMFVIAVIFGILGGRNSGQLLSIIGMIIGGTLGSYLYREMSLKPRFNGIIERASHQRQEYIRHAERRLQEEQAKKFDPMVPKPYSPSSG